MADGEYGDGFSEDFRYRTQLEQIDFWRMVAEALADEGM